MFTRSIIEDTSLSAVDETDTAVNACPRKSRSPYRIVAGPPSTNAKIHPAAWIPDWIPRPELVTLLYAAVRLLLLVVLIAGRMTSPSALVLLLLEGLRIFLSRLDPWGAVIVSAALLLYLFGPGPFRLNFPFSGRMTSNPKGY